MAFLHVREKFSSSLTEFSDIALGERNLPVTGLVVAIDSYNADTMHLAVMLEDGGVINVKVNQSLWSNSWKSKVVTGKVIEFVGDVLNSFGGSFVMVTKSVPKVEKELYNFKRNDIPDDTVQNTAFFVEIVKIHERKDKENSPLVVSCRSTSSELLYLKAFGGLPALRAESFKPGMVVNMAPVKFHISWITDKNGDTKKFNNIQTSNATVFQVATGVINSGPAISIKSLCDLSDYKTGDKIEFTGCLLRDIVDGATYVVDRPSSLDPDVSRPPRVGLIKIPTTCNFHCGYVVKGIAIVYTYDVIRLEYISLESVIEKDYQAIDTLLDFKKYKPMLVEVVPSSPSTPVNYTNNSYDDFTTPTGPTNKKGKFSQ